MNRQTKLGGAFKLPGTSLNVYRMGYGAMQLAGPGVWGLPPNIDEAVAVLRDAVAVGVNHREDLAPVFADLNKYEATTHFLGQSTIALDKDRATGETYCLAHHVSASDGKRSIFVASLRYYDVFVRADGRWLFGERKLIVDWTETRPIVN